MGGVVSSRRKALRTLILLTFGMALGKMDVLKAKGGELTVDLGQWERIIFNLHGHQIAVTVQDVFNVLKDS